MPALQLHRAAAAEERRPHAVRARAVEEHRQPELCSDPLAEQPRGLERLLHPTGTERHERDDVRRADPRVDAVVRPQVDELGGARNAEQERLDELCLVGDERVDGAVVVGVGVDVEQARLPGERLADGRDDRAVAPLGDVRHGFEQSHGSTLRSRGR